MKISRINTQISSPQSSKPCFKGTVEDFGKAAKEIFAKTKIDEKDELILTNLLKKSQEELLNPDRFLGNGFWGKVYRIDDNFVAKIGRNINNITDVISEKFKIGKNIFKDLSTYYGEPIGAIGRVQILKNVGEHIPAGIPSKIVKQMDSLEDCEKYYQEKYLPLFAKVPQESYDKLIKDISKLNKMQYSKDEYYTFDSKNPGNIVLANDKLFLIDDIDTSYIPNGNSVGKILESMLYNLVFAHKVLSYGNNVDDAREVLRKIIIASEKANLPYDTRTSDENIWKLVLLNCNICMKSDDFIQNLEIIRGRNPNLSKRIPLIENFIDKVYSEK